MILTLCNHCSKSFLLKSKQTDRLFVHRGEEIVRAGEPIEFVGIIVQGSAFVIIDHKNMKDIKLGDMLGHMYAADLCERDTHLATVIASSDGMIAVLPFNDIKVELRRCPEGLFKTY
jgi:CRP-like cAMP-binding protein